MSTTSSSSSQTAMAGFWDNVKTILYALALAMVLRFTIAQPFRIPSGSMQPTLAVGDYIVVTKWSYGYGRFSFAPLEGLLPHGRLFGSEPERGDVVVFRPPPDPDRDFIKRLVGLPGDRIQVINSVLHINGEPVQREQVGVTDECPDEQSGTLEAMTYRETLPNGVSYITCDKGITELDNTREFIVPEGHFFMMGDDRDNSADSRTGVVGYVPYENLVGPAQFVVVSFRHGTSLLEPWTLFTGFRGDRFLKSVN